MFDVRPRFDEEVQITPPELIWFAVCRLAPGLLPGGSLLNLPGNETERKEERGEGERESWCSDMPTEGNNVLCFG